MNHTQTIFRRCLPFLAVALFTIAASQPLLAANLVQEFYLPMPEAQINQANNAIISGTSSTILSTFSIVVTGDGTVIYYDQWEDGYETDLSNPTQSTTQIWGDGNDAHGIPPGFVHNPVGLPAGTIITLTNVVPTAPRGASLLYDARDHIAANKALVITRAGWPSGTGPVFAGAVGVLSTIDWGTNYISPVGQNMTNVNLMKYVGMFIMAAQNNTTVTIDPNGNGVGTTNIVLNQGESYLVNGGVKVGGRVTASKPIQADLIIGHVGASYAADWFTLYPASAWSGAYYTPVCSAASGSYPTYVYLYNSNTNAININYTTKTTAGTFPVPATNGVYQFQMPIGSGASFTSANGQNFYALSTVAAPNGADTAYNWGFTPVPKGGLTTAATVGWGPGSADGTQNGSPVWVTALGNTTLYVVYQSGSHPLTNSSGRYDTNFNLTALQSLKIYDPGASKSQTGMKLYTLDGTLITAAWGEDPDKASPGNPYIDAGTTVIPFPTPTLHKSVTNLTSTTGLQISNILQYTVEVDNKGLLPLGNVVVIDAPSTNLVYVTNSCTYNGVSIPDNPGPYNATNTAFPLDTNGTPPGYTIPILLSQGTSIFTYKVQVITAGAVSNSVNLGGTTISAQTYVPTAAAGSNAFVSLNFTTTNSTTAVGSYFIGNDVYVLMTNSIITSNILQTINVTVTDTNTGDFQTIVLTETATNSGVFRNITNLPTSNTNGFNPQDGILYVANGDTLKVSYTDPLYADSATTNASIIAPAQKKQLYLSTTNNLTQGNQYLYRVNPAATPNHGSNFTSVDIGLISWPYRQAITIYHTNVFTTDQTNFPVLVNLVANTGLQNHAQTNGNDIYFTASDGTTVLPYEREKYVSGTGALVAWVKIPILSHTADTVVYMYYGNSGASDQQQATNVWDSNFKGVWHLNQTPTGVAGDIVDSTGGNNGTSQTIAAGAQVAGKIGGSLTLDGTSDYISTATTFTNPQTVMLEAWVKTTTTNGYKVVGFEVNQTGTASGTYDRHIYFGTNGRAYFGTYNGAAQVATSTNILNDGQWHFLVGYQDSVAGKIGLYVDGVLQATTTSAAAQVFNGWYRIGGYKNAGWPGLPGDGYFAGSVDEIKLSHFVRSAGWIQTEYTNQASPATFYSIGSEAALSSTTNVAYFTQAPSFALPFTIATNGTINITNFITVTNGSFTASPNITATLRTNGVDILTLENAAYGTNSLGATNLSWSYTPTNIITIPANTAIIYVISNIVSGTAFHVNYDSTNKASVIVLPTTTVIQITNIGIYDAPYTNGNLVAASTAGSTIYIRVAVTDPFGYYDITSLGLAVTGPTGGSSFNTNLTDVNAVYTNGAVKIYEYKWVTGATLGSYSISATANEGTEGISASAATGITLIFLDVGTPSTTEFTSGNNGPATNAYAQNTNVCMRVTDLNRNTNSSTVDTIVVTVSNIVSADWEVVTLTETGTNTGIFTGCLQTTNSTGGTPGNNILLSPAGSTIVVTYTDPTPDANDTSSASAVILSGTPSISVIKSLVSPSGGQTGTNQTVTYNLYVANNGSTVLTNVTVKDNYPSGNLTFTGASPTNDTAALGLLTWTNFGNFAIGQFTNITVTFATSATTGNVSNSATAYSTTVTNVNASTNLTVYNTALKVTKILLSPTNTPIAVGSNAVFRITIQNVGNTTITNLPMEDYFSAAYYQYVTSSIPANSTGSGTLIWTNLTSQTNLLAGAAITNDVTMLVVGQGNPAYNSATVDYATDIFGIPVPPSTGTTGVVTTAASITGYVLNYIITNGVYSGTNYPISGVTLKLYTDAGSGTPGTLLQITTTAANGYYELLNLSLGNYVVVQSVLPGYASWLPVSSKLPIAVTTLTATNNNNFADYLPATTNYSTITGTVYYDANGNGTNDAGEVGVTNNVTIDLIQDVNSNGIADAGEPSVSSVTTDLNGFYTFAGVAPGHYIIRETDYYGYYSTGDIQSKTNGNQITFVATNGANNHVFGSNNFFDRLLPLAVNDTNSAFYLTPTNINPLVNDTNYNGDVLTITNATSTGGIVVINPGSTNLTFTPTNSGPDIITYTISDGHGGTSTATITVNVNSSADIFLLKSGPAGVLATSNVTYTISVTNNGPSGASSVTVTDALPVGVTWVSGGVNVGGLVNWSLGTLTNGQGTNLTLVVSAPTNAPASGSLTNVAYVSSPTPDPTPNNNTNVPVLTTVTNQADLVLLKTGPAGVLATSNVTYTISVTNNGPSGASSVTVTDALPVGVTWVSGGVNVAGLVNWSLGTLTNGQGTNLTLVVSAPTNAPASGSLTNVAYVSSPTPDPTPNNNTNVPVLTTVTNQADLVLLKSGPAGVLATSNVTYTISVTNNGPSGASSVTVTDALPVGVTWVSGGVNVGGLVNWSLGTLTNGQGTNLTLVVSAPTNAPASGSLTNVAYVSSPTPDPTPNNNTNVPVLTTVTNQADLILLKSGPAGVTFNTNFSYTISITNFGPSSASSISVTDNLPAGLVFVSANPAAATNGSQVVWTNLSLGVNASTNLTLTVNSILVGSVTNLATGGSPIFDPNPTNNVGGPVVTSITNATLLADLAIGKTAAGTVYATSNLTYTISVTNLGTAVASGVTVTDAVPAGATFVSASGNWATNANVVTWSAGSLTNGQTTNLTLTVSAPASGSLTNIASVGSPTSDPNPTNNVTPPVTTSVIPVADIFLLNVGPTNVYAGALYTNIISVTNAGPSDATNVVVVDTLPSGAMVTNIISVLPLGGGTNFFVTNTAPVTGPLTNSASSTSPTYDPDPSNNTNIVAVTAVTPVANIAVGKSGPAGMTFNTSFNYTISVTNFGPSSASGISVTDNLPAGLVYVSANPTAVTNASQVVWTNLSLALNATTNLTLTVNSTLLGSVTNFAAGGSPIFDPNPTNNVGGPVVTSITNVPPLANPDIYTVGENTTNSFSVTTNDSVQTPGGTLTIVSVSATNGIASIVNGTNIVFAPTHNFNGTATIGYTITDNMGGTNHTVVTVTVGSVADIVVSVTGPGSVTVGDAFFYTIVVSNAGPSTAINTLVTNVMPTNLVFSSASGGGVFTNKLVTWPLIPSLTNGQSTNFILTVSSVIGKTTNLPTANPFNFIQTNSTPSVGLLTNRAFAFATTYDPNLTNNSASTVYTNAQVNTLIVPGVLSVFISTNTYPTNGVLTNTITPIGPNLFIVGTSAFNPQTGLFEEDVTVTNIGLAPIHSVRLYIGGLRNGVTLYNVTGTNNGVPYVEYDAPYSAPLNPYPQANNHVSFQLEFYVADRRPFTNSLVAVATPVTTTGGINGTPVTGNPTQITDSRYQSDRFLIEFPSIPGRTYTILYGATVNSITNIAVPSIVASANVTQWYDDGPPKTISTPTSAGSRFYLVIQNN